MRRAAVVAVAVAAGSAGLVAGCGAGGDGDDPADRLAGQVAAALRSDPAAVLDRLGELGIEADSVDVTADDLRCPSVRAPEVGQRATCTTMAAGRAVGIDVEFGADDEVTVVLIEVQEE